MYRGVSLVSTGGVSLVRTGGVSLVRTEGVIPCPVSLKLDATD